MWRATQRFDQLPLIWLKCDTEKKVIVLQLVFVNRGFKVFPFGGEDMSTCDSRMLQHESASLTRKSVRELHLGMHSEPHNMLLFDVGQHLFVKVSTKNLCNICSNLPKVNSHMVPGGQGRCILFQRCNDMGQSPTWSPTMRLGWQKFFLARILIVDGESEIYMKF